MISLRVLSYHYISIVIIISSYLLNLGKCLGAYLLIVQFLEYNFMFAFTVMMILNSIIFIVR